MRIVALLVLAAAPALAQPPDSTRFTPTATHPTLRAARARTPIRIDGRLDEEAWASAEPGTGFLQLDPEEGRPASEPTEVRLLVDDEAIYVGARMRDRDTHGIRAHLARRDDATDSDYLEVQFDSFHDRLTAWRFRVNPAGAVQDGAIYADGTQDNSWDPVWEAAATVDSEGWTAEMRIPLSQLHYNQMDESTWGVQFSRLIHRKGEVDYFAFTPKREQAGVRAFADLSGLGRLPQQRHLELLPYGISRGEFTHPQAGDPFHSGHALKGDLGLDLKYSLSTDLTLSGTVNPDFGQAEVDPASVNLTAYETYYPEKRPFFVSDAGDFNYGSVRSFNNFGFGTIFYTRRIGRPPALQLDPQDFRYLDEPDQSRIAAAAKLTGKTRSGWTVGALEAVTTRQTADFVDLGGAPGSMRVEPATNYSVLRLARDLRGGDSQVGVLLQAVDRSLGDTTLRATLRSDAWQAGVDWNHAWSNRDWTFDGFLLGSLVRGSEAAIAATQRSSARYYQRPDAGYVTYDPTRTSLSGYYGSLALSKYNGEHWQGSVGTQFMSPGYEGNDLGYLQRADRYTFASIVMYNERTPGPIFRQYQVYPFTYHAWDYGGHMITAGYALGGYFLTSGFWTLQPQVRWQSGVWSDQLTRGGPIARTPGVGQLQMSVTSDSRRPYTLQGSGTWASNTAGSVDAEYSLSAAFHPTPGVQVSVGPSYSYYRNVLQYVLARTDPTATATYGSRYVFATADQKTLGIETRLNWVFSPKVSLQLYLQPYISSAAYRDYKEFRVAGGGAYDFYGRDRGTISEDSTGLYSVTPGAGGAPFQFQNPDFSYRSLRGNAVLRWEYRPGSTLFLIWQQSREDQGPEGDFELGRDLRAMAHARADNIVMAKVTTWFGM